MVWVWVCGGCGNRGGMGGGRSRLYPTSPSRSTATSKKFNLLSRWFVVVVVIDEIWVAVGKDGGRSSLIPTTPSRSTATSRRLNHLSLWFVDLKYRVLSL